MNDINDVKLEVGDSVLFAYATSGHLFKGTIKKFTAQGLAITHQMNDYSKPILNGFWQKKEGTTNLIGASQRVMKLAQDTDI